MPRFKVLAPGSRSGRDLPLSPVDLLARDDEAPERPMPEELAAKYSDRRIFISDPEGDMEKVAFEKVTPSSLELRLPQRAFLGRFGQASEYVPAPSDLRAPEPLRPFRPPWCGDNYHPREDVAIAETVLRRANGRQMRAHAVYPPENRRFFTPVGYPLHCVGRLDVHQDGVVRIGTATLVGPRTIVTSAHFMPKDGRPGRWGAFFTPAYRNGVSMVGMASWCEAYRVATLTVSDATQAFDVAVLKLYDPLGKALGWFGSRTYNSDWEDESRWSLIGYPADAVGMHPGTELPTIENGIRVVDDDPDGSFAEIEHMGDASDGNSGGPLFGTWPEGPYLIGVHSGDEYRTGLFGIVAENNNVAAGGNGMVNMVRKALADWP